MTNLLRFDFNDRDGIFEVVENGDWVRATDYDALAAKLAEVEEMKRLLAMDKINLRGELAWVQGKLAAANDQLDSARHSVTVLEGRADHFKARADAAEQRVATLEAALPATPLDYPRVKALVEAAREVKADCIARADKHGVVPIGRGAWDQLTAALAALEENK